MAEICCICEKEKPGKPAFIHFIYKSLKFSIFKNGFECRACVEGKCIDAFEKFGKKFIKAKKNGEPKINWNFYFDSYKEDKYSGILTAILVDLGVLSSISFGNWLVSSDTGIPLNPRIHVMMLYFTKKEFAEGFDKACFGNATFKRNISKMQ